MIERKIWKGDLLWLNESNAFWGSDVVRMIPGYFTVVQDSDIGDPLVELAGGYFAKRAALCELTPDEVRVVRALAIPVPERRR